MVRSRKVEPVHIGNSLGIRIPKPPRKAWRKSFAAASRDIDKDPVFFDAPASAFDAEDWSW
jgi:hypothetical protein